MAAETVYECTFEGCVLGSRGEAGQFTGGMTAEGRNLLTGEPVENMVEGEDYGDGICPNCGTKGVESSTDYTDHESLVGSDESEVKEAV